MHLFAEPITSVDISGVTSVRYSGKLCSGEDTGKIEGIGSVHNLMVSTWTVQ